MLRDELPDDLVEFLKSDRGLEYDAAECEAGAVALRALEEIEEIELAVRTEDEASVNVIRAFDLLKSCDGYEPRGMLVYIPALRKYGSYDAEKQSLITYRDISWSDFLDDPARHLNAGWFEDQEIAEETFSETDTDRIVEVCSAANAVEAGFLSQVLSDKGIRAEISGASLATAAGMLPLGESTAPRIWTREGDAGRAREIVQEWINRVRRSGTPVYYVTNDDVEEIVFPCQHCGLKLTFPTTSRGYVETCPGCGGDVDVPGGRGSSPLVDEMAEVVLLGEPATTDVPVAEAPAEVEPSEIPPVVEDQSPRPGSLPSLSGRGAGGEGLVADIPGPHISCSKRPHSNPLPEGEGTV